MSANLAYLPDNLQQAVLDGALLLSEAWAIQDQFLLANSPWVEMPEILNPQVGKLLLWQSEPFNSLPL
jgi:hypothetical protein